MKFVPFQNNPIVVEAGVYELRSCVSSTLLVTSVVRFVTVRCWALASRLK